jgi:hypothetical protein
MGDTPPWTTGSKLVFTKHERHSTRRRRVFSVHELEVEMGGRRVAGMTDPAEEISRPQGLAGRDSHRPGGQMDEGGKEVAAPHHDVVPHHSGEIVGSEGEAGP